MKPIWKQPYRDDFLERAGLYLLYAFILSISINPILIALLADRSKLSYVTLNNVPEPRMTETFGEIQEYGPMTEYERNLTTKYTLVDEEYIKHQKQFRNQINWIGITAILGWCCTSPRFQRGWPKLIAKIKNEAKSL